MRELGHRRLPLLDRLAAHRPGRDGPRQRSRPRLLRPPRRQAAGSGHPALREPLPLGPAAGARGRRGLAGARDRRGLRQLRRAGGEAARRPREGLDHAQRAVLHVLARLRPRCSRAREDERRRRAGRLPPRPTRARLGGGGAAAGGAGRRGRDRRSTRGRSTRRPTRPRTSQLPAPRTASGTAGSSIRCSAASTPRTCSSASPTSRRRCATATWRRSPFPSTSSASTTTRGASSARVADGTADRRAGAAGRADGHGLGGVPGRDVPSRSSACTGSTASTRCT